MSDSQWLPQEVVDALTKHDVAEIITTRMRYIAEHLNSVTGADQTMHPVAAIDAISMIADNIIFWNAVLRRKIASERE